MSWGEIAGSLSKIFAKLNRENFFYVAFVIFLTSFGLLQFTSASDGFYKYSRLGILLSMAIFSGVCLHKLKEIIENYYFRLCVRPRAKLKLISRMNFSEKFVLAQFVISNRLAIPLIRLFAGDIENLNRKGIVSTPLVVSSWQDQKISISQDWLDFLISKKQILFEGLTEWVNTIDSRDVEYVFNSFTKAQFVEALRRAGAK